MKYHKIDKSTDPFNEIERIQELTDLDLDYSDLEKYFKDLNKLAAKITGASISFVNLIDSYTQWSISRTGIDLEQMPREESVCQFTITKNDDFEVFDLSKDPRFADKFYVSGNPNLRYYYGVPLKTKSGANIGALCVLDSSIKQIDQDKKELLKIIANEVVNRISFLKEKKDLVDELARMKSLHHEVIHDIRGPISGIIGLTELIELDPSLYEKRSDLLEMISLIKKGGESVIDLAEEIMNQYATSKKTPNEYEFNCETFCKKLVKLYAPQARFKGVKLAIHSVGELDNIFFPKAKLLQIVGNLISNSIKFTSEGDKVNVELSVVKKGVNALNVLKVAVKDTGIGISQEKIEQIFNNADFTTIGTKGEKGFGFGLSLVTHLVNNANGSIEIYSKVGQGTTFSIEIPI